MSARRARVVAAYATVKIFDPASGKPTVVGVYKDGITPAEADPENVASLVRREYAEWVDEPAPEPEKEPATEPDKGNGRPAGNASRDDWAAYATGKGALDEETRPVDQGGLSRDDLRAKYGA